uniref:Uncharacterized protein n=1 Tax=Rhizophora mucronata TaxID=61149 RepID=A0A2P2QHR2_RHIMU
MKGSFARCGGKEHHLMHKHSHLSQTFDELKDHYAFHKQNL